MSIFLVSNTDGSVNLGSSLEIFACRNRIKTQIGETETEASILINYFPIGVILLIFTENKIPKLPSIFSEDPKIALRSSKGHTNVWDHFPKMSEDYRRFQNPYLIEDTEKYATLQDEVVYGFVECFIHSKTLPYQE